MASAPVLTAKEGRVTQRVCVARRSGARQSSTGDPPQRTIERSGGRAGSRDCCRRAVPGSPGRKPGRPSAAGAVP
jgi:hypothetical protein